MVYRQKRENTSKGAQLALSFFFVFFCLQNNLFYCSVCLYIASLSGKDQPILTSVVQIANSCRDYCGGLTNKDTKFLKHYTYWFRILREYAYLYFYWNDPRSKLYVILGHREKMGDNNKQNSTQYEVFPNITTSLGPSSHQQPLLSRALSPVPL